MAAKRRQFYIGQRIGNGWTVTSKRRVPIPQSPGSRFPQTLGIQVLCHCGRPFTVSITNIKTQLGCGCLSKNRKPGQRLSFDLDAMLEEGLQAFKTDVSYFIAVFEEAHLIRAELGID